MGGCMWIGLAYKLSEAENVLIKLKQGKIVGRAILGAVKPVLKF